MSDAGTSSALDREAERTEDLKLKKGEDAGKGTSAVVHDGEGDPAVSETTSQRPPQGEQSHGGSEGEALYGYGRNGGSIAGTGTRTDVPVGIEQVESSKAFKVSSKEAGERQGDPLPRTLGDERGIAGSTADDTNDQ